MSQTSAASDSEEDDLTPLEYARLVGISSNYLTDTLKDDELFEIQRQIEKPVLDHSHLPQFDFGLEIRLSERLSLSQDAARLLQTTNQGDSIEDINAIVSPMFARSRCLAKMKLEVPLLRTDHETDCKNFASRDGFEIRLQDVRLPLEMVSELDAEAWEGIAWPTQLSNLGKEIIENLKKERIQIPRDTIGYLQNELKIEWTTEDEKAVWKSGRSVPRKKAVQPVTPPLSPLYLPLIPQEPASSDPVYNVPLLSDPQTPTGELEKIEKEFFAQDMPTPFRKLFQSNKREDSSSDTFMGDGEVTLGTLYSPLKFLDAKSPPKIEVQRLKREDLKVEVPLTPEMPSAPKTVAFSENIQMWSPDPPSRSASIFEDDMNKYFKDAMINAAEVVNKKLEQEKLIASDTVGRVDVPLMDFTRADPPWKAFEQQRDPISLQSLKMSLIRDVIGEKLPKWSGFNPSDRRLKWKAIPNHFAADAMKEGPAFGDDTTWKAFLTESDEVINSSDLTWKPPGLKILNDDDDDDDEIELGTFQRKPQDLAVLAKKRKMEMDETLGLQQESSRPGHPAGARIEARASRPKANDFITAGRMMGMENTSDDFGMLGGSFFPMNSLDNYLEVRGAKKAKLASSEFFPAVAPQAGRITETKVMKSPTPKVASDLPIRKSPLPKVVSLPAPHFQSPSEKVGVIVSTTLLKHRALVKYLESGIPKLELIERDWTAYNTTEWIPGSVTRSPVTSPLDSEADLIVSPSTGVVITTLQKIKQKLLPGQKGKTKIRDRVEQVSVRYERLVVLITEQQTAETTNGLDEKDCLAIAEFVGFTAGLRTLINVHFIGGGEEMGTILETCGAECICCSGYHCRCEGTGWS